MKVRELIAKLQKCNPESPVFSFGETQDINRVSRVKETSGPAVYFPDNTVFSGYPVLLGDDRSGPLVLLSDESDEE